jgi:leucyl aminopeptidase
MIPEILQADASGAAAQLAEDEVLVVLGRPGAARPGWVNELRQRAVKALTKTHHYMTYHVGFLPKGGASYVVVEWQKPGVSVLERRWVAQKLGQMLQGQFNAKKLNFYLEAGSGPSELVLVEDVLTKYMTPLYERSQLGYLKILSPEAQALRDTDPFFEVRLRAQLGYRAWVNENPDSLTSIELGHRLRAFCDKQRCHFETYDVAKLTEMGMNLLLAVGQASERSPSRLHIATHNVKPGDKPLMLVGKGITFDTGGINLKPHEGFVNCMKNDMGGAGLMINLFMALVESGYSGPLAVVIPCCENLIAERSVKPGAIIKSFAGKNVIIEHTDAEGRLILADAITYGQKHLNPALTIVAATLTTASLRQFTNFFTAVHFANPRFEEGLRQAGKAWGEEFTFWGEFLPFLNGNRTNAADLTNMGRMPSHASMGGACNVAAHFLKEFASSPLVHVDIFATTWNWSGDYPGAHYGATGAPFNSLFHCIRQSSDLWGYQ